VSVRVQHEIPPNQIVSELLVIDCVVRKRYAHACVASSPIRSFNLLKIEVYLACQPMIALSSAYVRIGTPAEAVRGGVRSLSG
jgi:hypothetical protein